MNQTIVEKLSSSIGNRILVMMAAFPFFVVGELVDVEADTIHLISEFGVPAPLRGLEFAIQIEHVAALYAEECGGEIPVVW